MYRNFETLLMYRNFYLCTVIASIYRLRHSFGGSGLHGPWQIALLAELSCLPKRLISWFAVAGEVAAGGTAVAWGTEELKSLTIGVGVMEARPLVPVRTRQASKPPSASALSGIRTHSKGLSWGPAKTGPGSLSRSASSKNLNLNA